MRRVFAGLEMTAADEACQRWNERFVERERSPQICLPACVLGIRKSDWLQPVSLSAQRVQLHKIKWAFTQGLLSYKSTNLADQLSELPAE